jgi:hypothetical protein
MHGSGGRGIPSWPLFAFVALLIGGAFLLRARPERESPPPKTRIARAKASPPPVLSEEAPTALAFEPLPASTEEETSRAMDATHLRFQVTRLRLAVAEGDAVTAGAIQDALRAYGRRSDAILREEAALEADPVVRQVLNSTRALLR